MKPFHVLLVVLALLGGCNSGPEVVGTPIERSRPTTAPMGHDHGEAPAGHAPAGPLPAGHPPTGEAPAGHAPAGDGPEFTDVAGGLAWNATAPLVARRPSSSMRAAEYGVREHSDAELTVFHFGAGQGGTVDENIERWVGQLQQPDGRPSREAATIAHVESNGIPITTVDVRGTFAGMGPTGQAGAGRTGWRMIGAIAEGPGGMVFFKLTGPEAALDSAEQAFRELVESLRPAG